MNCPACGRSLYKLEDNLMQHPHISCGCKLSGRIERLITWTKMAVAIDAYKDNELKEVKK